MYDDYDTLQLLSQLDSACLYSYAHALVTSENNFCTIVYFM